MNCKLYIFDEIAAFTDEYLEKALGIVSPTRRDKALSYIRNLDRKLSVIAELLLYKALKISLLPEIVTDFYGKPHFNDRYLPCFNLSHTSKAVVCIVADSPVGVDVEDYDSYSEEIARTIFNSQELADVLDSPCRFAELWTVKESYLKFTGQGLSDNLPALLSNIQNVHFKTFHARKGYACTVCSSQADLNRLQPLYIDLHHIFND